jgi:hypothetical protein
MLSGPGEFDRNYYARVSRISNLGLIYSRVGMGFLDPLAESYDINRYKKEHEVQGLCLSLIGMHIYAMDSVRELYSALKSSRGFRNACRMRNPESNSQISRDCRDRDWRYFRDAYLALRRHAKELGIFRRLRRKDEFFSRLDEYLVGNLLVAHDSTFLRLASSRYNAEFIDYGYCPETGGVEEGVKVHVEHCVNVGAPIALSMSKASTHDSKGFENLYTESREYLSDLDYERIVYLLDKAYCDHGRFQRLCDNGDYFITPRKKLSMHGVPRIEFHPAIEREGYVIEDCLVKLKGMEDWLRLIMIRRKDQDEPEFELLTNILDLESEVIAMMYAERWCIEVLFKEVKRHFGLKNPIGTSDNALLIHVYTVFMAYLVLEIFKVIAGGRYSRMSMLELQREIRHGDILQLTLDAFEDCIQEKRTLPLVPVESARIWT